MVDAPCTSPDKGVPHKRIGVIDMIEKPKRVIDIREGRDMQDTTVEKEGIWTVGRCRPKCLSVYLLKLRHVRTFVYAEQKTTVVDV